MDPLQAIKEAEIICRLTEQYRAAPTARIPDLRELKAAAGLNRISANLEVFRDNLSRLQDLLRRAEDLDLKKEFAAYQPKRIEPTPFGFRAECDEEILYDTDPARISDFLRYRNAALVFTPHLEFRTAIFWEYQDCGRPEGCARVTDPGFAGEILYNRNFYLADACCNALPGPGSTISGEDMTGLVLNTLQNVLSASLAANSITRESLVRDGYAPLQSALLEYKELYPQFRLSDLDYAIEAAIVAIHPASQALPRELLLTLIRNIPFNVLPDELPGIVEAYRRQSEASFRENLEKTKQRLKEVDRIFSDETLFAALMSKLPPLDKEEL